MEQDFSGGAISVLTGKLDSVRRRHQTRRAIIALVLSLIVAACVYVIVSLFPLVTGKIYSAGRIAAGLWVLVAAGGLVVAFRGAPGLQAIARSADARFNLAERISTVMERRADWLRISPTDPVGRALMNDALRHVRLIDVKSLAPLAPTYLATMALALILSVAAAGVAQKLAGRFQPIQNTSILEKASADEPTAASIEKAAALIEGDAAARKDPYLSAVARSLRNLSVELDAGATTRPRAGAQLDALLEHAMHAYGEQRPKWMGGGDKSETLREQLQRLARTGMLPSETPSAIAQDGSKSASPPGSASAQVADANRVAAPQAATAPGQADGAISESETDFADGDYQPTPADQARLDRERQIADRQRQTPPGGGQPVGGAQEAGKGGNLAGEGVQQSIVEAAAFAPRRATDDLTLAGAEQASGRTIRMDVLPEARSSPVSRLASAGVVARSEQMEVPVARERISLERREIGRRYFGQAEGDTSCTTGACNGQALR